MVQHQDERGYILFYIFCLKTKQAKKENYHRGRKRKDKAAILQCCFVGMESP